MLFFLRSLFKSSRKLKKAKAGRRTKAHETNQRKRCQRNAVKNVKAFVLSCTSLKGRKTSNLSHSNQLRAVLSIANWLEWVLSIFYRKIHRRMLFRTSKKPEKRAKEEKCKHWTCRISGTSSLAMWNSKTNSKQEASVCVKNEQHSSRQTWVKEKINWIFAISRLMKFIVSAVVPHARQKCFFNFQLNAGFKVFPLSFIVAVVHLQGKHSKKIFCLFPYINEFSMSINWANVKRPLKDFPRKFLFSHEKSINLFFRHGTSKNVENRTKFCLFCL